MFYSFRVKFFSIEFSSCSNYFQRIGRKKNKKREKLKTKERTEKKRKEKKSDGVKREKKIIERKRHQRIMLAKQKYMQFFSS